VKSSGGNPEAETNLYGKLNNESSYYLGHRMIKQVWVSRIKKDANTVQY